MKINQFIYNYCFTYKNAYIIILICLYKFFFQSFKFFIPYFLLKKPDIFKIYKEEKFESFYDAFNNAKNFINNNINGKLMNKKYNSSSKNPKISAIIPCYNCKNYILKAVRSIQNQNFSDLEIIIGNDFSAGDTLTFLDKLKQEDSRISIINNKKNMGTLYTRTIGTLSSKGDYICPIDSDDMILDLNVFSRIFEIAEKGKFDCLIFNSIVTDLLPNIFDAKIYKNIFEKNHKPNLVLFQPELGYYPIVPLENKRGFQSNEILIYAKLIKSLIYKNALNKLGKNRFSRYMILGEDDLANVIIFNTAKMVKFISLYGYLHINRLDSVFNTKKNHNPDQRLIYDIYILDSMIVFSKENAKNKLILFKYLLYILKHKNLKRTLYRSKYDNEVFFSCLDRILYCKFISLANKNIIKSRLKSLKFIKYNFL